MNKRMGAINQQAAEPVAQRARQLVPRRSGRLAASIRTFKAQRAAQVGAGRASVPYAGPIHWGWPNRRIVFGQLTAAPSPIKSQPFLTDALATRRAQVVNIWVKGVDELLDDAWKTLPRA